MITIGINPLLWTAKLRRDHAALVPPQKALRDAAFNGWISTEAFRQALPDLAAATPVWRPLFTSETEVATETIALIRAGLAR